MTSETVEGLIELFRAPVVATGVYICTTIILTTNMYTYFRTKALLADGFPPSEIEREVRGEIPPHILGGEYDELYSPKRIIPMLSPEVIPYWDEKRKMWFYDNYKPDTLDIVLGRFVGKLGRELAYSRFEKS